MTEAPGAGSAGGQQETRGGPHLRPSFLLSERPPIAGSDGNYAGGQADTPPGHRQQVFHRSGSRRGRHHAGPPSQPNTPLRGLHPDSARAPAVTWQLGKRGMDRSPRLPWGTPRKRTIWTPPLDRHRGLGSRSPGGWSTCSRMRVPSKPGSGPSCSSQAARWSFACTRFAHRQPFGYRLADAEPVPELGACAAWGRSPWPDSIWLRRSQASARWTRSA